MDLKSYEEIQTFSEAFQAKLAFGRGIGYEVRHMETRRDLSSIVKVLYIFEETIGFTLGLYLFTSGLVLFEALNKSGAVGLNFAGLTLSPLEWTAFVFSFGILLEAILEVPMGILADSFGRRMATLWSLIFRALYLFLFVFLWWEGEKSSPSHELVLALGLIATACFSVHYTLMNGTFVAWVKDSLVARGAGDELTHYMARGELRNWVLFVPGCVIGIGLQLAGLAGWGFLAGAVFCGYTAYRCRKTMEENEGFDFIRWEGPKRELLCRVVSKANHILFEGLKEFRRERRLWAVFINSAAAASLFYLINYVWPIYCRFRFPSQMEKFSLPWILLILAFTLTSLLGSKLLANWTHRHPEKARDLRHFFPVHLVISAFNLIPILIVTTVIGTEGNDQFDLWLFILMMALHRFGEGALKPSLYTLENAYINPTSQHRATILSLGAVIKDIGITFLVFYGVGNEVRSLDTWLIPSIAFVFSTIFLTFMILGPRRSTQTTVSGAPR